MRKQAHKSASCGYYFSVRRINEVRFFTLFICAQSIQNGRNLRSFQRAWPAPFRYLLTEARTFSILTAVESEGACMKTVVLTLVTMLVLFTTSAAHAAMPIEYKNYPPDTQGGPTVLFCSASASLGQKCRKCYENFLPNGTTMNWVCIAVSSNATCKCIMGTETKSCTGEGECYYFL